MALSRPEQLQYAVAVDKRSAELADIDVPRELEPCWKTPHFENASLSGHHVGALLCGRSDDAMTIGAALIVVTQT
jgi:hypothetical protein